MSRSNKEGALSRWSRRKLESGRVAGETELVSEQAAVNSQNVSEDGGEREARRSDDETPIELPPIDELGPDSDFQGFMDPQVDDSLRRAALKKLFSDPHFNVTDGLDVYAEDYTKLESMTPAMVAGLKHARGLLFGDDDNDQQTDVTRPASLDETVADEASSEATQVEYDEDHQREVSESEDVDAKGSDTENGDGILAASATPSPGQNKVKV